MKVRPVTPIEIGDVDLSIPDNLPHENLPRGSVELPVIAIPTVDVSVLILVKISAFPPDTLIS